MAYHNGLPVHTQCCNFHGIATSSLFTGYLREQNYVNEQSNEAFNMASYGYKHGPQANPSKLHFTYTV